MARRMGKLSTKTIVGKITDAMIPEGEGLVPLYDVAGIARAMRTGESQYGPWVSFLGFGRAKRHSDGRVFDGDEVFLPAIAAGRVEAYLRTNPGVEVQYFYRVALKRGETQRYEYVVEALGEEADADPLAGLIAKGEPTPAIAAPETAPSRGRKTVAA